jgi:WD40 repeat protein
VCLAAHDLEFPGWTPVNVKPLLPPRQSRGTLVTLVAAAGRTPQSSGEIKVWNVQSHQLIRIIEGHRDCIYSIAWSPDRKLIASSSYDKSIRLWDLSTGKEMLNLQDHVDAVFSVAFSPDGKHLASAAQDKTVKIWDVATGPRLYTLSDALDGLTSVAFSPRGDQLTASGYDKTIYNLEANRG